MNDAAAGGDAELGVLSVELFFDLVFVFTITQLTSLLVAEPTGAGVAKVALIFGNLWWMYGGYAWLTNAVPPVDRGLRLLMLVGMGAFLIAALAIPHAFGNAGVAFGLAYLVVNAVHAGMFLRATDETASHVMRRLGPTNVSFAAIVLVAGIVGGPWRWALWTAAFVLHWASPAFTALGGFRLRAAHFVERHGLIVLIALGESVVAVGIGLQDHRVTMGFASTALLGLIVVAGMWWLYFDGEEERMEEALRTAPDQRSPWMGLFAYGYVFVPLLLSIVVFAAGMRKGFVDYASPSSAATAWFMAGGVGLYAASLGALRAVLGTGTASRRAVLGATVLLTVPLGMFVAPAAELLGLAAVLVAGTTAGV